MVDVIAAHVTENLHRGSRFFFFLEPRWRLRGGECVVVCRGVVLIAKGVPGETPLCFDSGRQPIAAAVRNPNRKWGEKTSGDVCLKWDNPHRPPSCILFHSLSCFFRKLVHLKEHIFLIICKGMIEIQAIFFFQKYCCLLKFQLAC